MFIFSKLIDLYESRGFTIRSSITPFILNGLSLHPQTDLSFSYIFHDGKPASPGGGGLHLTEILLIQLLGMSLARKNILVIGNSFGWSTFALALANPGARVVAIDACFEALTRQGLVLTQRIAREEKFDVRAFEGISPDDVAPITSREFDAPADLVLIDAQHDDEHQAADFLAARRVASPDCVYLFHDVIACKMLSSFMAIQEGNGDLQGLLLNRTQSGMGILFPRSRAAELRDLLRIFADQSVMFGRAPENGVATVSVDMPPVKQLSDLADPKSFA